MDFRRDTNVSQGPTFIFLIPKSSGTETGIPLEVFLSGIEFSSHMGLWQGANKLETPILRLIDLAKVFYNGCLELHSPGVTWQKIKDFFDTGYVTPTPISTTS